MSSDVIKLRESSSSWWGQVVLMKVIIMSNQVEAQFRGCVVAQIRDCVVAEFGLRQKRK